MWQTLDPLTGPTTGLRLIPRPPGGPRIFNATVRMADTTGYLGVQANDRNGGAGLTEAEAKAAALGEGIERYCAAAIDPGAIVTRTAAALRRAGEDPVMPDEIALFDESQRNGLPFAFFQCDTTLSWLRGVSLVTGRSRMVPASLVYLPYHPVHPDEVTIGPSISTGLSCGRSHLSAILAGLCECIERDAFAIVWRNRLPMPRLHIAGSRLATMFDAHFRSPNLHFHLFLISLDHAVPTVVTIVEDRNFDPPVICLGGATRPTVAEAALKALVEAAQGWTWARHERLRYAARPRPMDFDGVTSFEERVKLYARCDMREALAFLLDAKDQVHLDDVDRPGQPDHEVLEHVLRHIGEGGLDVIAVDLTTPDVDDLGLSVVKVFCPAFEQVEGDHRFPLLGGRRWRDVPIACGHREAAHNPAKINPFPHPYP